ncbi:hypothetical protein PWT90_09594 [Aphanocladium album]|nr:hypothetical protein PWT90_09594 [Aphanocladium album]
MDHQHPHNNGYPYYQMDPQVTGDQLSSHPTHDLHNAAYPESDYQPGMGYSPPPPGASTSHAHAVGQDSKPYPPPERHHELPSDSIHDAAYPDSNYRPGGGYSPGAGPSARLAVHDIDNAVYPDSHYRPTEQYTPPGGKVTATASDVIDNAAYPESNYRPGTGCSPAPSPGPSHSRPLPCPKHLESASSSSQSPWMRGGPASSAAGPSGGILPQATGSELPPPPYQPGGSSSNSNAPQTQPPSPSYSRGENPYAGYQTPDASSPAARRQQEAIPMTTFPVYQNAIGHVANNSNASSALERGYKEYDREQAKIDEKSRRSNRRKWLIGTLATTVVVAAVIGVVVALIKNKVFDDDDDD